MYKYVFSFTLKLITTIFQKLAIFHAGNVKQKDDETNQDKLHCCFDGYMNMWLQINKLK